MAKETTVPLNPRELVKWRNRQPGRYRARNGQVRRGWSQEQAAAWYGISTRQWQRYETGETSIPLHLVRRLAAHRLSFEDALDRILDEDQELVEEWGSPFEQLAGEKSYRRDIANPKSVKQGKPPVRNKAEVE